MITPLIPHLQLTPQVVFPLVTMIVLTLSIPLVIPIRIIFLLTGLAPLVLSHPHVQPLAIYIYKANEKHLVTLWRKFRDDSCLSEHHWQHGLREVELWENERWDKERRLWGKAPERKRWTRGADGWSPVTGEGSVRSVGQTLLLKELRGRMQ